MSTDKQALAICPEEMRVAYYALDMARKKLVELSVMPTVDEAEIELAVTDLQALTSQAAKSVEEIKKRMGVRG